MEGAGEMFQVTNLNLENTPKVNGKVDYNQDFFNIKTNLTVSGQLEALELGSFVFRTSIYFQAHI